MLVNFDMCVCFTLAVRADLDPPPTQTKGMKRARDQIELENLQVVEATLSRQDHLVAVAQQWRNLLELMAVPDSDSHGMRKPAETAWREWFEHVLQASLLDPPGWTDRKPAMPYVEMLAAVSLLYTRANEAAGRAKTAHARAQQRSDRSQKYHQRKEETARERFRQRLDEKETMEIEESAKPLVCTWSTWSVICVHHVPC